ncbi:MAG: ABC transporter ATP-binding protein [Proteobacteria bacterium]|nr:ABC transporter ATP-binding protein [Desulfobacteraceae bacterium]MBU0734268.1 ABC transporter ATP-binding protein [Pseudomonadota bacterium]MBU0989993.1 ABC transporter ATP-binding protein [Pseudomonadota bacterium]MBU1903281.1 ABC transporter ATP-binding protein [Pseudomonadota bacterium]
MLEVKGISVAYGDIQVLNGVTLHVKEGEIVTLIGSNGAGKTTTLNAISGLMGIRGGTITLDSRRIDQMPPHRIIELGATQIPEGRELFPEMTVLENLQLGAYLPRARASSGESLEWVYQLFPVLKGRRSQMTGTLSGGEQQMVAIARGLMTRPKVLMLDEPSLGLAPLVVNELFQIIIEINNNQVDILLVEQDVNLALEIAHRAYLIETGKIVMEGKSEDFIADDYVRESYLGI